MNKWINKKRKKKKKIDCHDEYELRKKWDKMCMENEIRSVKVECQNVKILKLKC